MAADPIWLEPHAYPLFALRNAAEPKTESEQPVQLERMGPELNGVPFSMNEGDKASKADAFVITRRA